MKRYSVYVLLKNGKDVQFESVDNPLEIEPVHINGAEMVMTKEQYGINLLQVERLEVVEFGKGKIGELVQ
ncbi:hypothetical protein [Sporosarcina sp. SAFN-010]|uniref:hypothetical protein n=1 Tax=Sporosarcina sp. SAFN-010 TaxID=3387273 RepID=UPI003F7E571B